MAKIKIEKSENTLKKEENKLKLNQIKTKKNITNDELKELLLFIIEKLDIS